ncbi:MAG: hypothetical protein U0269_32680 [Polyangiales bacterium]
MDRPDETIASRPATASSALLTAALSGLLCLTSACAPATHPSDGSQDSAQDAAQTPESSTPQDSASTPDVIAQPDASSTPDASEPDASVPAMDASAEAAADAASAQDAALDVRRPIDATCDVVPDRHITSSDAAFGITLEIFTAMCDRAGGWVEIHPHCGGANSCRGFSYDEGVHVFTEHTCAGLNTCNGFSCVLPDGV